MSAFEPIGRISQVAAAEQVIRALAAGDGIDYVGAAAALSELTGVELTSAWDRARVQKAMRAASEHLICDERVPGVRNVRRYGWVRMTDEELVRRYAVERDRRGRRQFSRLGRAAETADPERLTVEARLMRDHHMRVVRAVTVIEQQRAKRLRPPPAVEAS